jgi:hypothetical protein
VLGLPPDGYRQNGGAGIRLNSLDRGLSQFPGSSVKAEGRSGINVNKRAVGIVR